MDNIGCLARNDGLEYLKAQKKRLLLIKRFVEALDIPDKARCAELGAYPGLWGCIMKDSGLEIDAYDIKPSSIPIKYRKFYRKIFECNLVEDHDFSESYDVIFSLAVIEHLVDPITYLRNCYSLLKVGGILVIQTPNKSYIVHRLKFLLGKTIDQTPLEAFQTKETEGFLGHIVLYTTQELAEMLSYVGFSVERTELFNSYSTGSKIKRIIISTFSIYPNFRNQFILMARKAK